MRAEMATCYVGECEFFIGIWYEYAETNCMQTLMMEEVEQGPLGFEIVETGEYCMALMKDKIEMPSTILAQFIIKLR